MLFDKNYEQVVAKVASIVKHAEYHLKEEINYAVVQSFNENEPTEIFFWLVRDETNTKSCTTYEVLGESTNAYKLVQSLITLSLWQIENGAITF